MQDINTVGPEQKVIRVMVIDPGLEFRLMIRAILARFSSLEVVAALPDGSALSEAVLEYHPDVILMSFELPGEDGLAVLGQLMTRFPLPTIMLYNSTEQGRAVRYEAYRLGAIAVMERPPAPLHDESDWGERLLKTVRSAVGIRVDRLSERRFKEQEDTPRQWEKQIFFCEECGAQNILEREKIDAGDLPRCQSCGDLIPLQALERYHHFSVCFAMIVARDGIGTLLRLIPGLPEDPPAAFLFIIDDEDVDELVNFLRGRSRIRICRLHHRITVEGGTCYLGTSRELIRFSTATSNPTLEVESREPQGDENPFEELFASMARHIKEKSVGTVLGNCDERMSAALLAITLHGGQTTIFDPASFYKEEDLGAETGTELNISTDIVEQVMNIVDFLDNSSAA